MTTHPDPLATLVAARELISVEHRWTTGTLARDADGYAVRDTDPTAVCWCAIGAIRHTLELPDHRTIPDSVWQPIDRAVRNRKSHSLALINDNVGHAAVLEVFDAAIRLITEEGS